MKIPVLCGVFDGGEPHKKTLNEIDLPGFPGPAWFRNGNYRLSWEQRFHVCPKHGPVEIHEIDVLHEALNPGVFTDGSRRKRVVVALRPGAPRPGAPR